MLKMFEKRLLEGTSSHPPLRSLLLILYAFFICLPFRYIEDGQFNNNSGNDLAKLYSKQPGLIPIDDFTQGDRERVLELLLSQERVVSLIYAKTFPINPSISHKNSGLDNNGTSNLEIAQLLGEGNDYALSPGNPLNGSNNNLSFNLGNENRPSTSNSMAQNGNTTNNSTNNLLNGGNNAASSKGLTLPPVGNTRVVSR